jgi:hypothetical protein
VWRLLGGLLSALDGGSGGGFELNNVGRLTGLFSGGPGGTLGAPGVDGPCAGIC